MIQLSHPADDSGALPPLHLEDASDTAALGAILADSLEPGLNIHLQGDLGAGKTTLVRGVLRALGFEGNVKSPTYTLIEPYTVSRLDLYHFDFYRFNSPEEYLDAGLDEYFGNRGVCLVEWPDKAAPFVPAADIEIRLLATGGGRDVLLQAFTEAGRKCLTRIATHLTRPPAPTAGNS